MRPVLIVNPRRDRAFARWAEGLVDEGVESPSRLQDVLRGRYPKAVVHVRLLSGEPVTTWYVYRDGRWVTNRETGESCGRRGR